MTIPRSLRPVLMLLVAACVLTPAVAQGAAAGVGGRHHHPPSRTAVRRVIRTCAAGRRIPRVSSSVLRAALHGLPADVAEYTDCPERLQAAYIRAVVREHRQTVARRRHRHLRRRTH